MRAIFYVFVVVLVIAAGVVAWATRYSEIEPINAASVPEPSSEQIERGAILAAAGNCVTCHTVEGGASFAGNVPIPTPFGTIHSTNITPDPETGIGSWSEAAFRRAMREGVDREGGYLYPAFPYDHFTKLTDDDIDAIYAYLMTRTPVAATASANELSFPYNIRLALAGWNLLYLDKGPFQSLSGQDESWNRGAYLVEGLGHCGSCHTPRDELGAEDNERQFSGGQAEGWIAPALNGSSPAPLPWTAEHVADYLGHGWQAMHGRPLGPMAEVADNLQALSAEDLMAIGTYLESFHRGADEGAQRTAASAAADRDWSVIEVASYNSESGNRGEAIFAGACATCHVEGGRIPYVRPVSLALSTVVAMDDPTNFANVVAHGVHPAPGKAGAIMPGFGNVLDDQAIAELAAYVRERFTEKPPWENAAAAAAEARTIPHQ